MSTRGTVFDWINNRPAGDGDWRRGSVNDIAQATGLDPTNIQQQIASLKRTGNIDTLNVDNRIVAFKVIKEPRWSWSKGNGRGRKVTRREATEERPAPTNVKTPNLSRYAEAKKAYEQFLAEMPDFVEASFKTNDVAEEGLLIRERLMSSLTRIRELQKEVNQNRRELEYLRKTQNGQFKEALKTAGVTHGD